MLYTIKFIYMTFIMPPGIFIIGLLGLTYYSYRRQQRDMTKVLGTFTLLFYLATTSLVGDMAIRSLEARYQPPASVSGDVIVVLGGGATLDTPNVNGLGHLSGAAANRLLTGAQLYHILHIPILVSGGQVMAVTGCEAEISKTILLGLGVPSDKILMEKQSQNTAENARYTQQIMEREGLSRAILVTSAFHMERSVRQFAKAGLAVTPYPGDYQANVMEHFNISQLWPSATAVLNLQMALKEYVGLLAVNWY